MEAKKIEKDELMKKVEMTYSDLVRYFMDINTEVQQYGDISLHPLDPDERIYLFKDIEWAREAGVINEEEYKKYRFGYESLLAERFTILKDYIWSVDEKDLVNGSKNYFKNLLSHVENNVRHGVITDRQGLYLSFLILFRTYSAALKENPHGNFLIVSPQALSLYEIYQETVNIYKNLSKINSKDEESLKEIGIDAKTFKEFSVVVGLRLLSCPYEELEGLSGRNKLFGGKDFGLIMNWYFQVGSTLKELLNESETGEIHFNVSDLETVVNPGQSVTLRKSEKSVYNLTLTTEDYKLVFTKAYSVTMKKAKKEFMDGNYEDSAHTLMYAIDIAAELRDVTLLQDALSWVHDYTPDVVNKVLFIYTNADEAFKNDIRTERILEKTMVRFADNYISTHKINVFEIRSGGKTKISTSLDKLMSNMLDEYKKQVSDKDADYLEDVKKKVIEHIHSKLNT